MHIHSSVLLASAFAVLTGGTAGGLHAFPQRASASVKAATTARATTAAVNTPSAQSPQIEPTFVQKNQWHRMRMAFSVARAHKSPLSWVRRIQKPTLHRILQPAVKSSNAPTAAHRRMTHWYSTAAQQKLRNSLYWLARVIQAEAGGEPYKTKLAVGDVVLNRVNSGVYPHSVRDVVFQHAYGVYEFTCVENGQIYRAPTQDAVMAAQAVLLKHVNIVPRALVFYNAKQTSSGSWVRHRPIIDTIGHMTFAL